MQLRVTTTRAAAKIASRAHHKVNKIMQKLIASDSSSSESDNIVA